MRIFYPGKVKKMKKTVKSRNLFCVLRALETAGETGIGYKDSPWMGVATVWSDNNTGVAENLVDANNQNMVARASIL